MANTRELNLVLQEDGAVKWGGVLNSNFEIIDSAVATIQQSLGKTYLSSGLTEGIATAPTIDTTNNTITFTNLKCFFNDSTLETPSRTIESITFNFNNITIPSADSYANCYFGIRLTPQGNVEGWITIAKVDVQNYISDIHYIYLGCIAVKKENNVYSLATPTFTLNPWFSNYTVSNRSINYITMGTINDLQVIADGANLKTGPNSYYWEKEGINYSATDGQNHVLSNFLTGSGNVIPFFRASANRQLGPQELVLNTTIDFSYLNNDTLVALAEGEYAIMRLGAISNGKAVLFYGNQKYTNYSDIEQNLNNQSDFNTFIRVKEIARLVVTKDRVINIYPIETISSAAATVSFISDSQKNIYTVADAAEIRTNGIWPVYKSGSNELTYNSTNTTINFKGIICTKENDAIVYTSISNASKNISELANGWNTLYLYKSGQFSTSGGDAKLAYILKQTDNGVSKYKVVLNPAFCTTSPEQRLEQEYSKLKFKGMVSGNEDIIQLNSEDTNYLIGEGVNYKNGIAQFNLLDLGQSTIHFDYYDSTAKKILTVTRADDTKVVNIQRDGTAISNYGVQKLILLADGTFLMIGSETDYSTEPAIEDVFGEDENYLLNTKIGIELARFVVSANGIEKSYFSYINNAINSGVTVKNMTKGTEDPLTGGTGINIDENNVISLTTTQVQPGTYGPAASTTGGTINVPEITVDAFGRVTSANNKTYTTPDGLQLASPTTSTGNTAVNSLTLNGNTLSYTTNRFATYGTGSAAPSSTYSTDIYVDTTNHKIYIWDGEKYQLMNSWQ